MAGVTFGEVGFVTNLPTCHVADHGGGTELRPVKYPNTAPDTMIILWLWVIWDYNGITLYYSDIEVMGLLWGNYWSLWNTISNGIIFRDSPSLKCFQISQKPSTDDFFENNGWWSEAPNGGPPKREMFHKSWFFLAPFCSDLATLGDLSEVHFFVFWAGAAAVSSNSWKAVIITICWWESHREIFGAVKQ